jgi:hypothetical protein
MTTLQTNVDLIFISAKGGAEVEAAPSGVATSLISLTLHHPLA